MRLAVRVPVLSVQITVVQPRVSTDCRLRIRAFCPAIRRAAMERQRVTVVSIPSGTLATMMPMAKTSLLQKGVSTQTRLRSKDEDAHDHGNGRDMMRVKRRISRVDRHFAGREVFGEFGGAADLALHRRGKDDPQPAPGHDHRPGEDDVATLAAGYGRSPDVLSERTMASAVNVRFGLAK